MTRHETGLNVDIPPPLPLRTARILVWGVLILSLVVPAVVVGIWFDAPRFFRWFSGGLLAGLSLLVALKFATTLLSGWRIEREGDFLTVIKNGFWGRRIRRWPWSQIRSVSASRADSASRSGFPRESTGSNLPLFELRFEIEGERPLRLLRGWDEYELRWIAWTVRNEPPPPEPEPRPKRIDPPVERPSKPSGSRAVLESTEGGVRILLPALGVFRSQKSGALIGSLVLPVLSAMAIAAMLAFRTHLEGFWPVGVAACGLFILVGMLLVLSVVNERRRKGIVEATRDQLRIASRGVFGTRALRWPASQVRNIRGGFSGTTINRVPQMDLLVTLEDGKEFSWFKGRDLGELQWVASEVWRTLRGDLAFAQAEVQSTGGTCQICGTEMTVGVILCARCRTPHHEECWRYSGQCSTFGCREIRFTRN